jgi:hypothetical protein
MDVEIPHFVTYDNISDQWVFNIPVPPEHSGGNERERFLAGARNDSTAVEGEWERSGEPQQSTQYYEKV